MQIRKWEEENRGLLTLENITLLYKPENYYVIRRNVYEKGAEFDGFSKTVTKYILSGSCEISIADKTYFLQSNNYLHLPEGNYHFKVIGDTPVESVFVFNATNI